MNDARIVLFDLETLPNLPEALRVWPSLSNYPGITLRASITSIICAGWKVLGSKETQCICAWDYPEWLVDVNDDKQICLALYEVLKDADCVITHNGKRFDWKFLQTRLLKHKLPPLPEIMHVDTCSEAKRALFVFNNRLQTLSKFFTDTQKMDHDGWELWVRTHGRDPDAMRVMKEYCMQDVKALEAVFNEIRPLIKGLPNQNLFNPMKDSVCPTCGSTRLVGHGKRYTKTRAFNRYKCLDCHSTCSTDMKDELPRR